MDEFDVNNKNRMDSENNENTSDTIQFSGTENSGLNGDTGASADNISGYEASNSVTEPASRIDMQPEHESVMESQAELKHDPAAEPVSHAELQAAPATEQYGYSDNAGQAAYNNQQPKSQVYYTENIKKTKAKKPGMGPLVLVALLSSILGGAIVFAAMLFLSPVIQPAVNNILGITENTDVAASGNNGIYKKVEITKSSTPVEAISEKVSPSIVAIQVTAKSQSSGFFFDFGQDGVGEGSGIIIREDGYILTNNHVIESALQSNSNKMTEGSKIEVILPSDTAKRYEAKVIGRDSKTDIAVLKIEATNLPTAELGDSDKVKSGELAVAIGNPGGINYMGSVTAGIISGINRSIQMENGQELKLIQTDAAINPGNSGGALVNSEGQVIGVNTVKIAATGYEGLGFAIPINDANNIATSLIDYKYVKGRPYLGVSIDQRFDEEVAKQYNVPAGLLVYEVLPLSSAYKAEVKAGDIITKFDGKEVKVFKDLEDQKNKHKPGDKVTIEVYRDGKTLTLTAVLDEEKNTD